MFLVGAGLFIFFLMRIRYFMRKYRRNVGAAPGKNRRQRVLMNTVLLALNLSAIGHSACGQPSTPMPRPCPIFVMENDIDQLEIDTKATLYGLEVLQKPGLRFDQHSKPFPFVSAWEKCIRPSERYPDKLPCEKIEADYIEDIHQLLNNAKLERKLAADRRARAVERIKEREAVSQNGTEAVKPGSADAGKTTVNNPGPDVRLQPDAEPAVDLPPVQHWMYVLHKDQYTQYACLIVNPRSEQVSIEFLWKDDKKQTLKSFGRTIEFLKQHKKKPIMLMNAGIFTPELSPLGLFYANGKKLTPINIRKGEGNFYLEPTGLFVIEKSGMARIRTKADFFAAPDTARILHATQSGPMLVIDGKIHEKFNEQSNNFNIRNGVGVLPDGNIVFVLSRGHVSLHEFASVFRDRFKCRNALYLDGAISRMHLPDYGFPDTGGMFAGIIAVVKK